MKTEYTSKTTRRLILSIALMAILVVTTVPSAFANSPSYGGGTVIQGSDATLTIGPIQNSGVTSEGHEIQVVDQDPNSPVVLAGGQCPITLVNYAGLNISTDVWQLATAAAGPGSNRHFGYIVGPANGDIVVVKFGPSGASGTITAMGAAKILQETADNSGTFLQVSSPQSAAWANFQGSNSPNTNRIGNWYGGTCGQDNPSTAGAKYKIPGGFQVSAPVGGTILPIDATSLVLAGLYTSSFMWLLPAVGIASVIGLGIFKLRK